jgi:hypothetical protein
MVLAALTMAFASGCAAGTAYNGNAWGNVPSGTGMTMYLTRQESGVIGTWTATDGRSGVSSGKLTGPSTLIVQASQELRVRAISPGP